MDRLFQIEQADAALLRLVDAGFEEAARKSGQWLLCKPGCTSCCYGPFAISALDAFRLRRGFAELQRTDPERAERVRARAAVFLSGFGESFPGNPVDGILDETEEAEAAFAEYANDQACPALDPLTGRCDLYAARPMTCRTFGPPVQHGPDAIGVCELCYQGASDEEIARCAVEIDTVDLETELDQSVLEETHREGSTIVTFCLTN